MKHYTGNTFAEFYDYTEKLSEKYKGDLFEEITYHLFKKDPRLNKKLENIWLYKDIPEKILNDLSLPTTDKGIDLLAKINGEYCTIQCKFKQNPHKKIFWKDVATFLGLSFGISNKISKGYLVTNSHNLCKEIISSTKVESIYGNFFDTLPHDFFESIKKNINIKNINKKNSNITHDKNNHYFHENENMNNNYEIINNNFHANIEVDNFFTFPAIRYLYKCEKCQKKFKMKIDYLRHINRKKSCDLIGKYKCNKCIKSYTREDSLKRHMKSCYNDDNKTAININKNIEPCELKKELALDLLDNLKYTGKEHKEISSMIGKINDLDTLSLIIRLLCKALYSNYQINPESIDEEINKEKEIEELLK